MEDIKEKIKKLLRLSNSSNENEAKLAIQKAQELLAKHKLSLSDVQNKKTEVEKLETGIFYSHRKDFWRASLIESIASNYCVKNYISTAYRSSRHQICLVGIVEDMEVCMQVFEFASSHIEQWFKTFQNYEGWKYSTEYLNAIKNSYGHGFSIGVREVLNKQQEERRQEWGLVMVVPKEAEDFIDGLSDRKSKARVRMADNKEFELKGYIDGLKIKLNDKLTENDNS